MNPTSQGLLLKEVHVPKPLRGSGIQLGPGECFDVLIRDGLIQDICRTPSMFERSQFPVLEGKGGTLLSGLVDLHVHLDKTHLLDRCLPACGDLSRAIEMMASVKSTFTLADVMQRMDRALVSACAAGTRAMRTHIDWVEASAPIGLQAWHQTREKWRGKMVMQAVSLTPLDLFEDKVSSTRIAEQVSEAHRACDGAAGEGVSLGAFIYRNDRLRDKLNRVFDLGAEHGLSLDFHVDEGLDADASGLLEIARIALERDYPHGIVCGHACSLSIQSPEVALRTLELCAKASIHLVALPTTNLYLQGSWTSTPIERGLTRVREARNVGVELSFATDNVEDAFYPYGSYDLLDVFSMAVKIGHLADEDGWLNAITTMPASAMRLPWSGLIELGAPADLVLVRGTPMSMASAGGKLDRIVLKSGIPL